MYEKDDKRRLYWIINQYLLGKINEGNFCDEYYYCYDLELNKQTLNNLELQVFKKLSEVSSRFSKYEEDYKLDSKAFATVQELRKAIVDAKEKLKLV